MVLSQGTGDGKEISTCLSLWPHHRQGSGRRIPVQALLNELHQPISPPKSLLPTAKGFWHQLIEITGMWRVRAGFAWSLGPHEPPAWTCGTGKYLIQSCQLTEHHLPGSASNRSMESICHHGSQHDQPSLPLGRILAWAEGIQISFIFGVLITRD